MSKLLKSTVINTGLILGLIATSFAASAQQITFKQLVDYTMTQQMQQLQYDLHSQLEQSIYDSAFANLNQDAAVDGRRPVVSVTEVTEDEEDEE